MATLTDITTASPMQNYLSAQHERFAQTDEKVLRAYELQEAIKDAQKELDMLMDEIGTYGDENFVVVTDLKPRREFEPQHLAYIRENMPEVWRVAKPDQKYIWEKLCEIYSEEELFAIVRENDPERFEGHKSLTLTEFDKITGDSSRKGLYEGRAYVTKHRQSGKSRIEYIGKPLMMSAPSRYAELDDGEEDED